MTAIVPDIDRLTAETKDLAAERDALAARVDALEGVGGLPLIAVIGLAVLAGAAAGFAMAWLAGRPGRRPAIGSAMDRQFRSGNDAAWSDPEENASPS